MTYSFLYERLPNSTRVVPIGEIDRFLADRFGITEPMQPGRST